MSKPTSTVSQAHHFVLEHAAPLPVVDVPLDDLSGRTLAAAVRSDRDHPPFHRVAMDGIALRFSDLEDNDLFVEQFYQPAGAPPTTLGGNSDACVRVATGSVLPLDADTVVPVEHLEAVESGTWRVLKLPQRSGTNVHAQGTDIPEGAIFLAPGARLDANALGALATFGIVSAPCARRPSIALLCTGDEIVPPGTVPAAHQIRASHPAALRTALLRAGYPCAAPILVGDGPGELEQALADLPPTDLLLCTGGVSVGERDLVPLALVARGFQEKFHGVAMKPGKPLWFGVAPDGRSAFGLPGNPVSALVSLVRFVLPHLRARQGALVCDPGLRLPLEALPAPDARTRFVAANLVETENGARLRLVRNNGSGDLPGLVHTDGFAEIPPGDVPTAVVFRAWP